MSTISERLGLPPAYSPAVRDLRGSGPFRGTVVGLLVGTALLSSCSQKTEANDTLPPASSAPTAEALPSVGPADFPVPDEARTKDAAGAEAFLRYWIDLLNRQRAVPAGQPLRDLGPDCQECLRIARNYDDTADAGHQYAGGEFTLNDITTPQLTGDEATMNFGVRQEAVSLVHQSGGLVEDGPDMASNIISGIALVWSEADKSWLVARLNFG
jgi:hypothetical protein